MLQRQSFRYTDAVRMLGGESRIVKVIDDASAAGLLVLGVFDLFEARQEIIRLGGRLLTGFGERLRGVNRLTRTERIHAAHTIVLITAFFEALEESLAELGLGGALQLTAAEQGSLAASGAGGELEDFTAQWHEGESSINGDTVRVYYTERTEDVLRFVSGLAAWDRLDETRQGRLMRDLRARLPRAAAERYAEHLRRLAVDCPEFGVWFQLRTQEQSFTKVHNGLSRLEDLLQLVAEDALPDARRQALNRAYRAALDKPITAGSASDADLRIPTLAESYIDHNFRVAYWHQRQTRNPTEAGFWSALPVGRELHRFLAAHLISVGAQQAPLLVLGQPGSGKSVLTRILAARLSAQGFLPVRVELRQVPADAEVQDQIEAAIRAATGERVSWPRLAEADPASLPVVLLDGFDELLQATGVTQTDFLLRVARFQERERDQGRPVAVVVTSRTAVADRATIPDRTTVLHLEPFDDRQIEAWLAVWNEANAGLLRKRGTLPLSPEALRPYRELAVQPLLLLMLALYDVSTNGLHEGRAQLDQTAIYEELLWEFARREVAKDADHPDPEPRVEWELTRLSIVAFAMFNRRAQWIDEASLSADLAALGIEAAHHPESHGFRAALTPGQIVVGRFFFVHDSQATLDGRQLQTYEFLHATFSEHLVARMVVQLLEDLVRRAASTTSGLPQSLDDGMLHALLSFECLAVRAPIVSFLKVLINRRAPEVRAAMTGILLRLHRHSLQARTDTSFAGYLPHRANVVERHANWSANLVLLATMAAGEVTASELFPDDAEECAWAWRREALTWRSHLRAESWNGLVGALAVQRGWVGRRRELRLRLDDGSFLPDPIDLAWTFGIPGEEDRIARVLVPDHTPDVILRRANFAGGRSADMLTQALQPLSDAFPNIVYLQFPGGNGYRCVSAASVLLRALVAPYTGDEGAYADLVNSLQHAGSADGEEESNYQSLVIDVLTAALAKGALSPSDLVRHVNGAADPLMLRGRLMALVAGIGDAPPPPTPPALPASEASPPPGPPPAAS